MNLKFKHKLARILSVFMLFAIISGNALSVNAVDVDETVAVEKTESIETESVETEILLPENMPKETQIQETIHNETATEDDQDISQTIAESQFEVDVQEPQSEGEITDTEISEMEDIVERNTGKASSYRLYCYTLVPGMAIGDNVEANDKWNGMGVGTVTGLWTPGYYSKGIVATLPSNNITYTLPASMPLINVNETWYTYAAPGSGHESETGYYTIEWIRVVREEGANAGNNGYNPTVSTQTPTFHLDGQIFINEVDRHNVTFRVKSPGSDIFVIQDSYSKIVEDGYAESQLSRPDTSDVTYQGETYIFDGWYLDETCTIKANFDGTITEDRDYYGRYRPKKDKLRYDGNGVVSGTMNPTVGEYGGTVKVSANGFTREGYEFTGWNTQADGSGKAYEPDADYQLTPEDDVLYAQWQKLITVTVQKDVKGNMGDTKRNFDFSYTVTKPDGTTDSNMFMLKNGEAYSIPSFPAGSSVTVAETSTAADGYSTTVTVGNTVTDSNVYSGDKLTEDVTVIFTNTKSVTTPTGIERNVFPFIVMVVIAIEAMICFIVFYLRKRIR